MSDEPLFSANDQRILQSLACEANAEPHFSMWCSALIWPDESARGIEKIESLTGLWAARAMICHGTREDLRQLDENLYKSIWERALREIPTWPGFHPSRLSLSEKHRALLLEEMKKSAQAEDL